MEALGERSLATSPDRRPACAVHVDLDGYADICRVHGWPFGGGRDPIFESGMRNALEFLSQHRIPATLFAIAQDVRDAAKSTYLREATRMGHDFGSHTTTHRNLTRLAPAEQQKEIGESREILQQALGTTVAGFRAPGFAIDAAALGFVAAAGYRYDSSLFPDARTAKRLGLAAVPGVPHSLGAGTELLELPMPAYAPLPFPFHPSYSLVLGNAYFRMGLARARRTSSPLILLFHLTDFAEPLPRESLPHWKARFYTLSYLRLAEKLARCARMLDRVRKHYRIVGTADLVREYESAPAEPEAT